MNSIRKLLLEGRQHSHIKPGRHTPLLKVYSYLLDPAADPTVHGGAANTRTLAAEVSAFGVLMTDPEKVLELARATF